MRALKFTKEHVIVLLICLILSSIFAFLNLKTLGIKDTGMLFSATMVLLFAVYLALKNKKASVLLFIAGFPFLVTARKAVYFDFLIFKVTYETIYVTIFFVLSFKEIKEFIRDTYYGNRRSGFNYLIYTGIFLVFALNSAIYSPNAARSIGYTYISVAVPVMFMLSLGASFKSHDVTYIYDALILQNTLSCLYGFFQIFSDGISPEKIAANRHALTFGFHNVNVFAGILVLILPVIVERILDEKNKKIRLLLYVSFLINTGALFITYTRGAWLAFLASMFIVGVVTLYNTKYRKVVYGIVVLGLIAVKPVLSFIVRRGTSTSLASNESAIARIQSFVTSFKIMSHYPFGGGAGNFADMYKEFSVEGYKMIPLDIRAKMTVASYNLEAAHNLWLQISTELGIVCAVVFFIIIINRLTYAVRNFKHNRANIAAIIAYLIFSLLTGVEFEHKGIITATLIIWLIFITIDLKGSESISNERFC